MNTLVRESIETAVWAGATIATSACLGTPLTLLQAGVFALSTNVGIRSVKYMGKLAGWISRDLGLSIPDDNSALSQLRSLTGKIINSVATIFGSAGLGFRVMNLLGVQITYNTAISLMCYPILIATPILLLYYGRPQFLS